MRSKVLAGVVATLVFAGGCSDDDEDACADLRGRLTELESTPLSGSQSFDDVEQGVNLTVERDALVAEMTAKGCSTS